MRVAGPVIWLASSGVAGVTNRLDRSPFDLGLNRTRPSDRKCRTPRAVSGARKAPQRGAFLFAQAAELLIGGHRLKLGFEFSQEERDRVVGR